MNIEHKPQDFPGVDEQLAMLWKLVYHMHGGALPLPEAETMRQAINAVKERKRNDAN